MKVYIIRFDGGASIVEAETFGAAVESWRAVKRVEWGTDFEETDEPESVELIHDEPVIRAEGANTAIVAAAPDLLKELLAVEWGGVGDLEEGGTEAACPSCGGGKSEGHHDGCALRAAIAKAGGSTNPLYTSPTNGGNNELAGGAGC